MSNRRLMSARSFLGTLTLGVGGVCACLAGCHAGAQETPVAMTDVPPPVRATLIRESQGGQITEIEKEIKKGKTIYSADITVNGVAWDVSVAEDGTLISKEQENGEEK